MFTVGNCHLFGICFSLGAALDHAVVFRYLLLWISNGKHPTAVPNQQRLYQLIVCLRFIKGHI